MSLVWRILDDDTREKLWRYQRRCFNCELNPPHDPDEKGWRVEGKLETTEEIGRLMRKAPKSLKEGDY